MTGNLSKQTLITAIVVIAAMTAAATSCCNREKRDARTTDMSVDTIGTAKWNGFSNIPATDIPGNFIQRLESDWMLITSGTPESFNTMTASWGGIGVLWGRPVTFIMVRNTRYTYEFLQANESYTLSFFGEEHRAALVTLGSKSGREGDKITGTGLTPVAAPDGSMTFNEAQMVIECRKIYSAPLALKNIFDEEIIMNDYIRTPEENHVLYIGEIDNVWYR